MLGLQLIHFSIGGSKSAREWKHIHVLWSVESTSYHIVANGGEVFEWSWSIFALLIACDTAITITKCWWIFNWCRSLPMASYHMSYILANVKYWTLTLPYTSSKCLAYYRQPTIRNVCHGMHKVFGRRQFVHLHVWYKNAFSSFIFP